MNKLGNLMPIVPLTRIGDAGQALVLHADPEGAERGLLEPALREATLSLHAAPCLHDLGG